MPYLVHYLGFGIAGTGVHDVVHNGERADGEVVRWNEKGLERAGEADGDVVRLEGV